MKPYTTKHILSIIGFTLLIGLPFGFLFGWWYCIMISCCIICYGLAVFFKNPTHPILAFNYPDWMDTSTIWQVISSNILFAIAVLRGCTELVDSSETLRNSMIISIACLLCFLSGYLTRKVWLKNMPQ